MSSSCDPIIEQPFFGFHMPNYSYPGVAPEHSSSGWSSAPRPPRPPASTW